MTTNPNPEPEKPAYPEELPTTPLVSPALQDILSFQFADHLDNGAPTYLDGFTPNWGPAHEAALAAYRTRKKAGQANHVDLILAQAYKAASSTTIEQAYKRAVALAGYVLDWTEQMRERGVEVADPVAA